MTCRQGKRFAGGHVRYMSMEAYVLYYDAVTSKDEHGDSRAISGVDTAGRLSKKSMGIVEKPEINLDTMIRALWEAGPEIHAILLHTGDVESTREALWNYLNQQEWLLLKPNKQMHALEKTAVRGSIRVLKNIIGPANEQLTGISSLEILWELAHREDLSSRDISPGFVAEFIHLFRGVAGKSGIYPIDEQGEMRSPMFLRLNGRAAGRERTVALDRVASKAETYLNRYPTGLDPDVIERRERNKQRILRYFGATEEEWESYMWQIRNVIRSLSPLENLIELIPENRQALQLATRHHIPFGITPYYLSLFDERPSQGRDHAVRAQVLPPLDYVHHMVEHRSDRSSTFDFMGEHDTSPIAHVTRRYPGIAIIKPFKTCAQICVYCQRNWEIDEVLAPTAMVNEESLDRAISWFEEHPAVGEVLITGGDPCIMKDSTLKRLLDVFSEMKQISRIRIGTRTPVVLPMRWTETLVSLLSAYHEPGRREVAVVTHVEHPYEITPELLTAITKIRSAGMSVYNQQVFTVENSRRFETAKLRKCLRVVGIDPYYTFNVKGKFEMKRYRVPVARLLQERKEEARLFPGLDRTDEPVLNIPRMGKNHLRSGQDHRLIMIRRDGSRIYEIDPWEKNLAAVPTYVYTDVPIYDYLNELARRGENPTDYDTIWYYY